MTLADVREVGVRPPEMVVARYGELWLKGKNRSVFERALVRNARAALAPIAPVRIERQGGQLAILPEGRATEVAHRLRDVFGLASISPAWGARPEPRAIATVAREVMRHAMDGVPRRRRIAVRVATKRADKRFPMISSELDRYVAELVLPEFEDRVRVDLRHPELSLGIQVRAERAYLFAERLPGAGGLPVGTLGHVVCLLSGGIDSPVAAYLAMKRGCRVTFAAFHSYPYLGASSQRKIERLARALTRYQPRADLLQVPFTAVQEAIRDRCPEPYRTVLYRRMMQRIASRLAQARGAGALVTGESLGQVASQTLENLTCIGAASSLPVLRPLVTCDKTETIALARRIGTFELSIEPEPDCCTVFRPRRPVIRGRLDACAAAERALDVEALVAQAVEGTRALELTWES